MTAPSLLFVDALRKACDECDVRLEDYIYTVESRRRQTFPPEDWPISADDWPGATRDELDTVRKALGDL